MESNTEKFDLMKLIRSLDRESKVRLVQNWDNVIEKSASHSFFEGFNKQAKLHDPETAEHLIEILDLLEKFLKIDEDISFKNICLFINPMMFGSKKITLRPYRLISLINRILKLSKAFEKEYRKDNRFTPTLRDIKTEFHNNIKKIRTRLMSFDNKIVTTKKPLQSTPEFSRDKKTEEMIRIKIKKSPARTASKICRGTLAETIDQMVKRLKNYDIVMAQKILDQTTYGYGEDFDNEIKKEIYNRLR